MDDTKLIDILESLERVTYWTVEVRRGRVEIVGLQARSTRSLREAVSAACDSAGNPLIEIAREQAARTSGRKEGS